MNKKLKNWLINIGLVIISIIVFLVLFEFYLSIFHPQSDSFWRYDKYVGTAFIPNKEGRYVSYEGNSTYIKINSHGWRDKERSYEKGPDTSRIIVLGDSFTAALEVPIEQSFSYLLEDRLNNNLEYQNRTEVLNLGVNGIGTAREYLILKHYGLKYKPDLVVLAFFPGNDVVDNYFMVGGYGPTFILDDKGKLAEVQGEIPNENPIRIFIKNYFPNSYFFLKQRLNRYNKLNDLLSVIGFANKRITTERGEKVSMELFPYEMYSKNYSIEWQEAWNLTKALILETKKTSEENGAKFLLVILTWREQVHPNYWEETLDTYPELRYKDLDLEKPTTIVKDFCSENNITCLELLPYFREYANKTGNRLHYHYDGHWNSNGHELAAELIYNKIIEDKL